MNTTNENPPAALAILADAFGCPRDDVAVLATAIAAGLAGPRAGLKSALGFTTPGFNLAIATPDPAWQRLLNLFLEPARYFQTDLRNYCRSLSPQSLDTRSVLERQGHRGVSVSVADTELDPFLTTPIEYQRQQAVLHPTLMLTDPDARSYSRGLRECGDRSPFVVTGFPASTLSSIIARDCGGTDRVFESKGPGSVDTVRPLVLLRCNPSRLGTEFSARNPLLDSMLITSPPVVEKRDVAIPRRQRALQQYIYGIKECIRARHSGSGIVYSIEDDVAESMDSAQTRIDAWVRGLPAEIQPYLRDASTLPLRLLWAFQVFATESDTDLHHGAIAVAESVLLKSSELLTGLARAQCDAAEAVMLGKLRDEPSAFRGLVRRYRRQQSRLHQPVLDNLLRKGWVQESDKLFHVTGAGLEYLRHHGSSSAS